MAVFRSGQSGLLLPGHVRPTSLADIVVPDGLVRYWPLDVDTLKSATVQADLTGTANATLGALPPTIAEGQIGKSYNFTAGATSYIDTSVNNGITRTTPFSISLWAQSTTSTSLGTLLTSAPNSGAFDGPWLLWGASGFPNQTWIIFFGGGTVGFTFHSPNVKALNLWYHLAWTYDGSNTLAGSALYENGEWVSLVSTGNAAINVDPTNRPWRIGNDVSPANTGLTGFIDDVRVYNRPLSSSEIRAIYVSGLQGSRDQAALGIEFSGWADDEIMQAAATGTVFWRNEDSADELVRQMNKVIMVPYW